jgi:ABC-type branched-subunit amino acid transport system substrate-binding protein
MKIKRGKRNLGRLCIALLWTVLLHVQGTAFGAAQPPPAASAEAEAEAEALRLGERMYRAAILPSGAPLRAPVTGDSAAPGTVFACASCHLRSGLGSLEEGVYTPPVNGEKLYRPHLMYYKRYLSPPRPAYTDAALMTAIRSGTDPAGRVLNDIMPRYPLTDDDARLLVSYLKSLSAQVSPGVTDTTLKFATVITDEVSQEERDAMLAPLNFYFKLKNSQIKSYTGSNGGARARMMAENMVGSKDLAAKGISLSQWILKGPPETWRGQLEEYYRNEPVFALLGGISRVDWKPVHHFSEDHGIPCLFPITDFPVISDTDWYTLYLSKGYYQEGESAARYLSTLEDTLKGRGVVQIVRSSAEGRALAAGFQRTWGELGQKGLVTLTLAAGQALNRDFLDQALSRQKPAALLVWDDSGALPALSSLVKQNGQPELVFLSSRYLGESIWSLQEELRGFTYLTYPYAFSPHRPRVGMARTKLPGDTQATLRQADLPVKDRLQAVTNLTTSLTELFSQALIDLKANYYRDGFLDVIGAMMEQPFRVYGRVDFGAGQRYAARGCYIVQLSKGAEPELVKKSDWEIH